MFCSSILNWNLNCFIRMDFEESKVIDSNGFNSEISEFLGDGGIKFPLSLRIFSFVSIKLVDPNSDSSGESLLEVSELGVNSFIFSFSFHSIIEFLSAQSFCLKGFGFKSNNFIFKFNSRAVDFLSLASRFWIFFSSSTI